MPQAVDMPQAADTLDKPRQAVAAVVRRAVAPAVVARLRLAPPVPEVGSAQTALSQT
jgi:hypothetical protein